MDFINKLTHQEAEHEHSTQQQQEQPAAAAAVVPPPPTSSTSAAGTGGGDTSPSSKRNFLEQLIAGTGGGHGSSHDDDDDDDTAHLSFLDKLTRKHDREARLRALEQREAEVQLALARVARDQRANEGLLERIKDHFDGDDASPAAGPPKDENKELPSFLDKLAHPHAAEHRAKAAALAAEETRLRAELAQIARDRRDCQGVLARLQQHLARDEEDGTAQKAKDEDPSFFDKITGRAAEAERRRKEEENKSTLDKVKDRIEEGMGGGKKAEEKEDFLDKSTFFFFFFQSPRTCGLILTHTHTAIDGFQEHVLRKGDQSDESVLEQLKDEQIAAAIRAQLHLKDKEDK